MKHPRIFLAALAATLLSTSALLAAPPSADQVTVQGSQNRHEAKMNALFATPEQRMMFKSEMRQATRGMTRDQKKAYHKQQMQQIKAMGNDQKAQWRQDLEAKWNAMPVERQTQIAQKMERHAEKHQQRHQGQNQYQDDQQDMGGAPPPQQ
jgi:hypothetical protein